MQGKVLVGRYQLEQQIGKGGMAAVFRAMDQSLERAVAIKVMNPSFFTDYDLIDRFIREAKATAKLDHPNIMQVYDVGVEEDSHYMVMELLEGGTLKDWIQYYGTLPIRDSLEIIKQVLFGLAKAHQSGIIHRDLKPQNILRNQSGVWKLGDFGIAKVLTSTEGLTKTGNVMGTVRYFSPEQARGVQAVFSSDLYSIGILLYEMLTGRVPFDGEEAVAIAIQHLQSPLPDPRIYRTDIPDALTHILYRALEKQPEKRYQSAYEMIQEIEQVLQQYTGSSSPLLYQTSHTNIPNVLNPDPSLSQSRPSQSSLTPSPIAEMEIKKKRNIKKKLLNAALIVLSIVGLANLLLPTTAESDGVNFELTGFFSEKQNSPTRNVSWVTGYVNKAITDGDNRKSEIQTELRSNFEGIDKLVKEENYILSYLDNEHYYMKDQSRNIDGHHTIYRNNSSCYEVGASHQKWNPSDCFKMEGAYQDKLSERDLYLDILKQFQQANTAFASYNSVYSETEYQVAELTIKDLGKIWGTISLEDKSKFIGSSRPQNEFENGLYQIRLTFDEDGKVIRIQRMLKLQANDPSAESSNVSVYQDIKLSSPSDAYDYPK
ncbi:protein kinase domain-containing protein [Risungbinella massiliensis]|uniref:protein kinase domain-containing protein n=1 Tax=Risungbinella massiliensis TaxID=1329796 RepID=UPI00069BDD32|nr:protein kinase [Risungbinella massiliensis]